MEKETRVPINIWDDYYEDGYVPDGEIQETYAYVESSEFTLDEQKEILTNLLNDFKTNPLMKNIEMELEFYSSRLKYPNLVGTEYESILFDRWNLNFKNFPHKVREKLVEQCETINLSFKDLPFEIYSSS